MGMHYGKISLSIYDAPKKLIDLLSIIYPKESSNETSWIVLPTEKADITFFEECPQEESK